MEKERVLFLCTGNSARSQMAEGLLRQMAGAHYEVHSAGLDPTAIHPMTIKVLEEIASTPASKCQTTDNLPRENPFQLPDHRVQ